MQVVTQIKIRSNPYLYQYLRDNSFWYKELNRNPLSIKEFEEAAKKYYHLTPKDKLENINQGLTLVKSFLEFISV